MFAILAGLVAYSQLDVASTRCRVLLGRTSPVAAKQSSWMRFPVECLIIVLVS
jgi:hypothetical protein